MAGGSWLRKFWQGLQGFVLGTVGKNPPKNLHVLKRRESSVLNVVPGSLHPGPAPALGNGSCYCDL